METKGPVMDRSPDNGLPNRYKLWKQKCILLFETTLSKNPEEYQCKIL